jgi:D-tyrosyl-tRNA(Tyr) deacylase
MKHIYPDELTLTYSLLTGEKDTIIFKAKKSSLVSTEEITSFTVRITGNYAKHLPVLRISKIEINGSFQP